MKKLNLLILFVLTVTLVSPIGAGVGFMVGRAWNSGAFAHWRRLPDPPMRPVQIVGGSTTTVFIETTDGQVYYCNHEDDKCWVKYNDPVSPSTKNDYCEQHPFRYVVSAAPGKVIDYLQTQWCHFEAGSEADYAILEDGSVWMWNHFDANFLNLARAFGAAGGGCSVGLLAGIAVSIYSWRRGRARQVDGQIQDKKA